MPAVQAEQLLRELDEVWVSLGKQQEEAGGVLRACAITLIAVVDDAADIGETLADIMHDNPSRAIVIRLSDELRALSARAFAQCWMPFGRRQQICCEQVEISASSASFADVPSVLRGLLAPDLPVVLWVRHPDSLKLPAMAAVMSMAHKVVVEPRGYDDWKWLMAEIARLNQAGVVIADLAWTRITRWRDLTARLFDNPERRAQLAQVDRLVIEHSSPEPGPAVRYLAAWIGNSLGRRLDTRFHQAGSTKVWQIQSVTLSGPEAEFSLRRTEHHVVQMHAAALESCTLFPLLKEAELLREELAILGPDPVFQKVLAAL